MSYPHTTLTPRGLLRRAGEGSLPRGRATTQVHLCGIEGREVEVPVAASTTHPAQVRSSQPRLETSPPSPSIAFYAFCGGEACFCGRRGSPAHQNQPWQDEQKRVWDQGLGLASCAEVRRGANHLRPTPFFLGRCPGREKRGGWSGGRTLSPLDHYSVSGLATAATR